LVHPLQGLKDSSPGKLKIFPALPVFKTWMAFPLRIGVVWT
jgi:hypothetical protein